MNFARWSKRFDVRCSRAHVISSASSESGIAWYGRSGTLGMAVIVAVEVCGIEMRANGYANDCGHDCQDSHEGS